MITPYSIVKFCKQIKCSKNQAKLNCWLWKGFKNQDGYGQHGWKYKQTPVLQSAHRFSWNLFKGEIGNSLSVLHKCDVRNCVNPDHLFLGTLSDNSIDMLKKGRHPIALTVNQVKKIREDYSAFGFTVKTVANKYGITPGRVYRIVHNVSFAWIKR